MKQIFFVLLLLMPMFVEAQMLVYTVAGSDTAVHANDGGPATAAGMAENEGVWMDGLCNLYISDQGNAAVRKVDGTTGIITTVAGGLGLGGPFDGDGGPATNAHIRGPYGLYADDIGNVYFSDRNHFRIRRIDAITGIITTVAGGGSSLGDGGPATNAQLTDPPSVYLDKTGNMYIADKARVRKVTASTGIITTIAGTGVYGYSGDGGPATSAQVYAPVGMIFDSHGNLFISERGNAVIRKISPAGIITTIVGSTAGYSGDGGPATNAQISNSNSIAIDRLGNLIIGDLQNNVIRRVDATTNIITTVAGDTSLHATALEGAPATTTSMHPEFLYLDLEGNLYYSSFGRNVRKITNFTPGLPISGSRCGPTAIHKVVPVTNHIIEIFPNPTTTELTITASYPITTISISSILGQTAYTHDYNTDKVQVDVANLPPGIYIIKINGTEVRKFIKQ